MPHNLLHGTVCVNLKGGCEVMKPSLLPPSFLFLRLSFKKKYLEIDGEDVGGIYLIDKLINQAIICFLQRGRKHKGKC